MDYVTLFVIEETSTQQSTEALAKEYADSINSFDTSPKKTSKNIINQRHFWLGRNGAIHQGILLNKSIWEKNWYSNHAVVASCMNNRFTGFLKNNDEKVKKSINSGSKILNYQGNVGGKHTPKNGLSAVKVLNYQEFGQGGINSPSYVQILPSEIQCRRMWETILFVASNFNPYKDVFSIPIKFPAALNASSYGLRQAGFPGNNLGTGFATDISSRPLFNWFGILEGKCEKNKELTRWWNKGMPNIEHKPTQHHHRGIVSTARWSKKGTGQQIEYYCLGRALGLSSQDAYYAMIGAMALASNNKQHNYPGKGSASLPTGYTYFPDDLDGYYINLGKQLWGNNGPLNWNQKNSDYIRGKQLLFLSKQYSLSSNYKIFNR